MIAIEAENRGEDRTANLLKEGNFTVYKHSSKEGLLADCKISAHQVLCDGSQIAF